jgi:hypothetical protein
MPLTKNQIIRRREKRKKERFKAKQFTGQLTLHDGFGIMDMTAFNAACLLRGKPEKMIGPGAMD